MVLIRLIKEMRNLVSIRKISSITPIENADAIELAHVSGWDVVVKKGEFSLGQHVLYFEIDSFLPDGVPEWQFLVDKSSKMYHDVKGHVLRTIKLRGQVSQGLILPLFGGLLEGDSQELVDYFMESLGVEKYDPPIPLGNGEIKGNFPLEARKTNSERAQNLTDDFLAMLGEDAVWIASEKIDGTSATFIKTVDDEFKIATRNWEVDVEGDHAHAIIASQYCLAALMPAGSVIQGEIYGEGIQKNPLKVKGLKLAVFYSKGLEGTVLDQMLEYVPEYVLEFPETVKEAVKQVDGLKSLVNPKVQAEGVVWWNTSGKEYKNLGNRPNFKAINNKYLLKHGG